MPKQNDYRATSPIVRLFLSICVSLMLCMYFPHYINTSTEGYATAALANLSNSMYEKAMSASLIAIIIFYWSKKIITSKYYRHWAIHLYCILLSLFWLTATCYKYSNSLYYLYSYPGQITKSVVYFLGGYFFSLVCILGFTRVLEKRLDLSLCISCPKSIKKLISKHIFVITFVTSLLVWLPHVIIAYPAFVISDGWRQLAEFYNIRDRTVIHPVIHTAILGLFSQIGLCLFNSGHAGLFIFIVVQAIVYALICSYSIILLRNLNAPRWLYAVSFGLFYFSPFYLNFVNQITKDSLFSIIVLLFIIELIHALNNPKQFVSSKRHLLLTSVSILGMIWFRNNGRHILYPTLLLIYCLLFMYRKKLNRRIILTTLSVSLIPIIIAEFIEHKVVKYIDAPNYPKIYLLSLPIQQTARYLKTHSQEVTLKEKEVIDKIIIFDGAGEAYDPFVADPVTHAHKRLEATNEDFINYLRVWWQMFLKHPITYINATLNQSYPLFYPFQVRYSLQTKYGINHEQFKDIIGDNYQIIFHNLQPSLEQYYYFLHSLPFIGLLSIPGIYAPMIIGLVIVSLISRRYKFFIVSVPLLINIVVVLVAPLTITRYLLPIIYPAPVLIAYYINMVSNKTK